MNYGTFWAIMGSLAAATALGCSGAPSDGELFSQDTASAATTAASRDDNALLDKYVRVTGLSELATPAASISTCRAANSR